MRSIIIFVLVFQCFPLVSQEWELQKSSNGIEVYVKNVPTSQFDAFKAVMIVEGSVDDMNYILHNLDKFKHIFPDTKELDILKRDGDKSLIQYSRTDAPWPADDRDGIYDMTFFFDAKTGTLKTKGIAKPNYLPEKEGVVRIAKSVAFWRVFPKDENKILIEYEVEAEPGGNIPDWVTNSALTKLPFNTFVNLREVLAKM